MHWRGERTEWCPSGAFTAGENEVRESTEASSGLQRQQCPLRRLRLRNRGSTPLCSTKTLQINVCKVFTLVVIPVAIVFLMGIPFSQISLWACIISIVVTNWNTCISLLPEKDKSDKQGGKRMKYAIKTMAVTGICGAIY